MWWKPTLCIKKKLDDRVKGSRFVVLKEHFDLDCNAWDLLHFSLNGKIILMVILSYSCVIYSILLECIESFWKLCDLSCSCWISVKYFVFYSHVTRVLFNYFLLVSKWYLGSRVFFVGEQIVKIAVFFYFISILSNLSKWMSLTKMSVLETRSKSVTNIICCPNYPLPDPYTNLKHSIW